MVSRNFLSSGKIQNSHIQNNVEQLTDDSNKRAEWFPGISSQAGTYFMGCENGDLSGKYEYKLYFPLNTSIFIIMLSLLCMSKFAFVLI